jgi:hypothetical protein
MTRIARGMGEPACQSGLGRLGGVLFTCILDMAMPQAASLRFTKAVRNGSSPDSLSSLYPIFSYFLARASGTCDACFSLWAEARGDLSKLSLSTLCGHGDAIQIQAQCQASGEAPRHQARPGRASGLDPTVSPRVDTVDGHAKARYRPWTLDPGLVNIEKKQSFPLPEILRLDKLTFSKACIAVPEDWTRAFGRRAHCEPPTPRVGSASSKAGREILEARPRNCLMRLSCVPLIPGRILSPSPQVTSVPSGSSLGTSSKRAEICGARRLLAATAMREAPIACRSLVCSLQCRKILTAILNAFARLSGAWARPTSACPPPRIRRVGALPGARPSGPAATAPRAATKSTALSILK